MKQLDSVIAKDPLKIRRMESSLGTVTTRTMYIFFIGIPVCLLLSLTMYFFAGMMVSSATTPTTTSTTS